MSWVSLLRIKVTHFRLLKIFKDMIGWKHVWWAELSIWHWLTANRKKYITLANCNHSQYIAWIFLENLLMEYQEKPNVPRSSFSQPDKEITMKKMIRSKWPVLKIGDWELMTTNVKPCNVWMKWWKWNKLKIILEIFYSNQSVMSTDIFICWVRFHVIFVYW